MRSIGIDLGEDSIKIIELIQNKKSPVINALFEKRLSPLASSHDKDIECIEFIRSLFAKNDFSNCQFVMAVRQDKATIRKKSFPFSDRLKIQKSLSFEMEEDIPFDPDNCIFDFKTISYSGPSTETLSAAVPKSHIEKIAQLAKDFGVQLKIITLEGLAFSNLLETWQEAPPEIPDFFPDVTPTNPDEASVLQKCNVHLHFGHKRTLLLASLKGRVVFIRSLMWGTDLIIQELMKRYQLPYSEAQKTLENQAQFHLTKGHLSFEQSQLNLILENSTKDLIRDIQMSFLEIESELKATVADVHMTGGFSTVPHLGAFLTQHLETPCNDTNLILPYLSDALLNQSQIISNKYTLAIAIALETYKRPKNPAAQFLKGEFANQDHFIKTFWSNWGPLAQVGIAAVATFFIWTYLREDFSMQLNEKGTEAIQTQAKSTARLPKKQANEKGLKKYISENKKIAQEFKAVQHLFKMNSAIDVLKKISDVSPSKDQAHIDLTHVDINDNKVILSGYANSPREVVLFNQKISVLSLNKKVNEESTTLPALPNRVAFSTSFTIDRGLTAGGTQ